MADVPTHDELVQIARDEMLSRNSKLRVEVLQDEGHPANIVVNTGAAMSGEVGRQLQVLELQMSLETANGEALDRLVYDRYALLRSGASPSLGTVEMSRPGGGELPAVTVARDSVLVAEDGTRFRTLADAVLSAGAVGPVSVDVRSDLAGAGQAAAADTITAFETTPADSTLQVTNPEATAGDSDADTDPELREIARRYFVNAQRSTLAAIEYGARTVPGCKFAVAVEVTTPVGEPARWVKLHVADRNGTSSAAFSAAVHTALLAWRPGGMHVQVIGGLVTFIELTIGLKVNPKLGDPTQIADNVRAAVVAALAGWNPKQDLLHSDIIAVCKGVVGVVDAQVIDPPTALTAADGETFRTKPELITITGL